MVFKDELQKKVNEIDEVINSYLPDESGPESKIYEAVNYSIQAGGKRLRPVILIESFEMFYNEDDILGYDLLKSAAQCFATALEFIHTYSLVHDDLPAMDNDMYRRGKKTTHAVFGHAMGILAGDALLNMAFELITSEPEKMIKNLDDSQQVELYKRLFKAANIIAAKAGSHGMIGGQVIDIEAEGKNIGNEEILAMYRLKTSALLEAAMTAGAVIAGACESDIVKLEKVACNTGLAFQIQDDILDEISTSEELGKPVHSDEKNKKPTYFAVNGLNNARNAVKELTMEALDIFDSFSHKNDFLRELILSLVERKK